MATRAFIRRSVGRYTRQCLVLTATAAGTSTSLIDAINLADPNNTLVGRIGWVCTGNESNLQRTIRVTANNATANSISFTPALPQPTGIADEVELWNDLDQGVTPQFVNDMINVAIASVDDAFNSPARDDSQSFSNLSPVLSIPVEWRWFYGADYQDDRGIWHPLYTNQLRVDRATRTVELIRGAENIANGRNVRLRGAIAPEILLTDSSDTSIDAEWIVNHVSYLTLVSIAYTAMDGQAIERYAGNFKETADGIRMKARARQEGMGIILP